MRTACFPFKRASEEDSAFKLILNGQWDKYWKLQKSFHEDSDIFNEDFMDLINRMLNPDAAERPSFDEIRAHRFFQGESPNDNLIQSELEGNYLPTPKHDKENFVKPLELEGDSDKSASTASSALEENQDGLWRFFLYSKKPQDELKEKLAMVVSQQGKCFVAKSKPKVKLIEDNTEIAFQIEEFSERVKRLSVQKIKGDTDECKKIIAAI